MSITDDRGREFEARPIPAAEPGLFKALLVIWIPLVVGVPGIVFVVCGLLFTSWPAALSVSGIGAGLCLLAWFLIGGLPGLLRIPPPITDDSLRAEGRCLVCGYPLVAITPESDGCRVCPVCTAAWGVRACEKCGYLLAGVTRRAADQIICPECGTIRARAS